MVRAWYMDNENDDKRLEHHLNPPKFVSLKELHELSGVEYTFVNPDNYENNEDLKKVKIDKNITYDDAITCSRDCIPDYDEKLKIFYQEHLHTDEEIRYILEGSGYFDVRDKNDEWIRIEVTPGDLLIIPSGIYHRFTLDIKNYIKAKRYFAGEPVWTPHNRPAEEMNCRKEYLKKAEKGFA